MSNVHKSNLGKLVNKRRILRFNEDVIDHWIDRKLVLFKTPILYTLPQDENKISWLPHDLQDIIFRFIPINWIYKDYFGLYILEDKSYKDLCVSLFGFIIPDRPRNNDLMSHEDLRKLFYQRLDLYVPALHPNSF